MGIERTDYVRIYIIQTPGRLKYHIRLPSQQKTPKRLKRPTTDEGQQNPETRKTDNSHIIKSVIFSTDLQRLCRARGLLLHVALKEDQIKKQSED